AAARCNSIGSSPACPSPSPSFASTLIEFRAMPFDFLNGMFVLMLSTFIGLMVIQRVSRLLHTPLMSLTNAISAIAVVGAILLAGEQETRLSTILGAIAVFASTTNIVSGFLITDRMLKMFKRRDSK